MQWITAVQNHFGDTPPEIGILFAGFERSQICHADDNDIATVLDDIAVMSKVAAKKTTAPATTVRTFILMAFFLNSIWSSWVWASPIKKTAAKYPQIATVNKPTLIGKKANHGNK